MRRASVVSANPQLSQSHEELDYDENGNFDLTPLGKFLLLPGQCGQGLVNSRSVSNFGASKSPGMTSRPSFISLMLIASDDELQRMPRLPAPLQVETDTYQKCGWEDEPKVCSHLPILKQSKVEFDSDDETETHRHNNIFKSIIHLPERIRKVSADKHRFNVYALPDQDREQLKNLVVY